MHSPRFPAKFSVNTGNFTVIIALPMLLRVLLLCFLNISSWINTVFLTLIDGNIMMFILQPHEGKKYWTALFPQLVTYLTSYTTAGCWVSPVIAVRDATDILYSLFVQATVFKLCSIQSVVFVVGWYILGGWVRKRSLTHQGSSASLSIGFCTIFDLNERILG